MGQGLPWRGVKFGLSVEYTDMGKVLEEIETLD